MEVSLKAYATEKFLTIPEDLPLNEHEKSLLSKGLNYIPTRAHTDEYTARADSEKFFRRIRLKAHFHSEQESSDTDITQNVDRTDDFNFDSLKPTTSRWTPPPGKFAALDYFVSKCRSEISKLNFRQRLVKTNLTPQERAALTSLRQRRDVIIKPPDKGGAVVVWARHLYIQEAEKQLSDNNFYQQQDRDYTADNNNTVKTVIRDAITKGELPESATNLTVDNPRTPKFYLLPKIHKPGNPGRPIVSACNCPTELIATYLDKITTPLVQSLPSYVNDTNHMLRITESFRFPGNTNYVFTMDVKSLYTTIPNRDGLLALTHFLDKRAVLQPPTHTLVHLAELALTLNTFTFNGKYYRQTGGVAMGSRLGPNYACLFMGHIEEQIFDQYPGRTPSLYKRYIDDIVGATSGTRDDIEDFASFVNGFHPSLNFTWSISDKQLPFLDLCLKPTSNRIVTTIHYKETDTHSYLNYESSQPTRCKNSIPYSQFLRMRRICSDERDFEIKSKEMSAFFRNRGYPSQIIKQARDRVSVIPHEDLIPEQVDAAVEQNTIPLVLTYHPTGVDVPSHQHTGQEHNNKKL